MIFLLVLFLLFTPFFSFLAPVSISRLYTIGREGCFFVIIFYWGITFLMHRKKLTKSQIFVLLLIVIEFVYFIFSSNKTISYFILYISGPLLFLSISSFTNKNIISLINKICLLLFFFIIINLILYNKQQLLIEHSRIDTITILRNLYRDKRIRFFGLMFQPTIMAFICVTGLIICDGLIKKIISFFAWYLTGARSFIPGVLISSYFEIKKKKRLLLFFIFLPLFILIVYLFLNSTDASLLVHFDDLFYRGPKLVLENFYGRGFGYYLNLESDIYYYCIGFGVWGGVVYIICFISIFFDYNKRSIRKNSTIIKGRMLLIIYCIGAFFIPFSLQRPLSNIFWIVEGLIYSYRRQLCKKVQ